MYFFSFPFREPSGLLVQFLHAEDLDATAPQMARHRAARAQGWAYVRGAPLPRGKALVGRQGEYPFWEHNNENKCGDTVAKDDQWSRNL